MHARYEHKEENDPYSFHRLIQGYEIGEFIRLTSCTCDAVIVGGDLNMDDSMIGFNFIKANSGVKDAWFNEVDTNVFIVDNHITFDINIMWIHGILCFFIPDLCIYSNASHIMGYSFRQYARLF